MDNPVENVENYWFSTVIHSLTSFPQFENQPVKSLWNLRKIWEKRLPSRKITGTGMKLIMTKKLGKYGNIHFSVGLPEGELEKVCEKLTKCERVSFCNLWKN